MSAYENHGETPITDAAYISQSPSEHIEALLLRTRGVSRQLERKLAALSARNTDVESWLADAEHRVCELAGALRTIEKLANGEGEPLVLLLAIRERARAAAHAQETPTLAIAKSAANTTPGWNHTGTGVKLTVEEAQAPETPTLALNKEDSAAFIDALMNPRPPSERLKQAMARRKELVQDKETQP